MKILVITQYFWPEEFRVNDICIGLKEFGHEVEILTGLPNYPKGKIFEGYSYFKRGSREYKGMKVMRVGIVPRGNNNFIMLFLNYLSFMISASIRIIPLIFRRYDRIFVFQVSPLTTAIPAIILSKLKKIPSYIYVQDLWPETLYSIVNISNKYLRRIMKKVCNLIYKSFDKLLIASKGYEEIFLKDGVKKSKIEYLPQWAEDLYLSESIEEDNHEFTLTFAGNIGKAQSVNTIIEAANLAKKDKDIKWNIIGDGSELKNIKELVEKYSLQNTVKILGRKPLSEMPKYFSKSDVLIVTLKNEDILKVTLPAKVQSYMASGKPILASINGEGSRVIREADCGLVCEAEDYVNLYKNAIELYKLGEEKRRILGGNGRKYFNNNFTREKLLNKLEEIIG